jgi:putative ABC transport system substrate-binding protein
LETRREQVTSFRRGLAEQGYFQGQNIAIEYRWAEGRNDLLPALAADLVSRGVAVIAAPGSTPATLAAQAATRSIPIIFWVATDPVELGLVDTLNSPGGNLTGIAILGVDLAAKRVEILHELVPTTNTIGLLINPSNSASKSYLREVQAAVSVLGLKLVVEQVIGKDGLEDAFARLQGVVDSVTIMSDPIFFTNNIQLVALAAQYRIPTISPFRAFTMAGGLLSYGSNLDEAYRQVGLYTGRILKGERVAELPVQQATKIELSINIKTAKELGINIPMTLLSRADEMIE